MPLTNGLSKHCYVEYINDRILRLHTFSGHSGNPTVHCFKTTYLVQPCGKKETNTRGLTLQPYMLPFSMPPASAVYNRS